MVYTRETTEMKKIINNPNAVVEEMLQGIEIANPDVLYDREGVVIARKEKSDKVGLVSGGGSGHEPAHAGYVGYGMLMCSHRRPRTGCCVEFSLQTPVMVFC